MRLILAAFSFLICLFLIATALTFILPNDLPDWMTGIIVLVSAGVSLVITNKLVNVRGTHFWSLARAQEPHTTTDKEGLIVSTLYHAGRFFEVRGATEEGAHYFIELNDKSILYLNGRYLNAFKPRKILNLVSRPGSFPCTEFEVKRDRYDGCVVGVQCRGAVLSPEAVLPPFTEEDIRKGTLPNDGDIIASRTYDEMKETITGERGRIRS